MADGASLGNYWQSMSAWRGVVIIFSGVAIGKLFTLTPMWVALVKLCGSQSKTKIVEGDLFGKGGVVVGRGWGECCGLSLKSLQ